MRLIASLFTIATLGAGYLAYNSKQPLPFLPSSDNSDYAGMVLPYLKAAFSPLDPTVGKLSDAQLANLRQEFARESGNVGAKEAVQIVDQLFPVLAERETFRAKLNTGATDTSNDYFNAKTGREWLARANVLAPPLQSEYTNLVTIQEKSGKQFVRTVMGGYLPYFQGAQAPYTVGTALEQRSGRVSYVNGQAVYVDEYVYSGNTTYVAPGSTTYVAPGGFGTRRFEGERRLDEHRSPFEEHRLDERRSAFDDHRTGLEERRSGWDDHRTGFDEHRSGLDDHRSNFNDHRVEQQHNVPVTGSHTQTAPNNPPPVRNQSVVHPPPPQTTQMMRPAGSN